MTKPLRQQHLEKCIDLTTQDRNNTYGGTYEQHKLFGELWSLVAPHIMGKYSPAHNVAFLQVVAKISRIALGRFHLDNYLDGANYFVIAAECEETEQGKANSAPMGATPGIETASMTATEAAASILRYAANPGQALYEQWAAIMACHRERVSPWEALSSSERDSWYCLAKQLVQPASETERPYTGKWTYEQFVKASGEFNRISWKQMSSSSRMLWETFASRLNNFKP